MTITEMNLILRLPSRPLHNSVGFFVKRFYRAIPSVFYRRIINKSGRASDDRVIIAFLCRLPRETIAKQDKFGNLGNNKSNWKMVLLGELFPNFTANTSIGPINFHEWLGDSWAVLFSHPNDFTPVCTTELARVAKMMPDFEQRGVKVIGLSCNTISSHMEWIEDIKAYGGITEEGFPYPIIEDEKRQIATKLGMLDPAETDNQGLPLSARAVFVIDPAKKMRLSILYPATTGRSFDEILRVIDSLQLTEKYKVATPVDWKNGNDVMIQPTLSNKEAQALFGNDIKILTLPSSKEYIRVVPQPTEF